MEVAGSSLRFSVNGRAANRETSAPCLQTSAPCLRTSAPCLLTSAPCLRTSVPCLRANVHVYLVEHSTEPSEEVGTFVSNNLRMHHPYLTIRALNEHCTVNQHCGGHNYSHTFVSYVGNDSDVLTLYVRTFLRNVLWRTLRRTFVAYVYTVGAKNTFPFRSELRYKTSGQLRTNFEPTSEKLRANFRQTSGQLGTNFGPTSHELRANFARTSGQLGTNFEPTSDELRANLARTSGQLRTNFAPTSDELRANCAPTSRELRASFARTSGKLRTNFGRKLGQSSYEVCSNFV